MKRMRVLGLSLALVALAAGCSRNSAQVTFDGQHFRGSAKAVERGERLEFNASVRDVSKSLEGAREAVRFEGTKYCIRWTGSSEIEWEIDPLAEELPVVDDTLTLRGRCVD